MSKISKHNGESARVQSDCGVLVLHDFLTLLICETTRKASTVVLIAFCHPPVSRGENFLTMTSWLVIIAWDKKSGGTAGVSVQHTAQRQGRPPEDSRQKERKQRVRCSLCRHRLCLVAHFLSSAKYVSLLEWWSNNGALTTAYCWKPRYISRHTGIKNIQSESTFVQEAVEQLKWKRHKT